MKKKTTFIFKEVEELANQILDDYYEDQKIWYKNFQIADKNDVFYDISAPSTWFFYKDWNSWSNRDRVLALTCYIYDFCLNNGWRVVKLNKSFENAVK